MGALRYKEPSTVEECDSTWGTDSESDEQDSAVSESTGASDSGHCGDDQDGFPQVNRSRTVHTNCPSDRKATKKHRAQRGSSPSSLTGWEWSSVRKWTRLLLLEYNVPNVASFRIVSGRV